MIRDTTTLLAATDNHPSPLHRLLLSVVIVNWNTAIYWRSAYSPSWKIVDAACWIGSRCRVSACTPAIHRSVCRRQCLVGRQCPMVTNASLRFADENTENVDFGKQPTTKRSTGDGGSYVLA